jgi:hypothetical protein
VTTPQPSHMVTITSRKAVTAAVFTFAGTLGAALSDGQLTVPKLVMAAGTALTAYAATWLIPMERPSG